MRIDIISAVPSLLESPFNDSILKRAKEKKLVEIKIHNLRDYSINKQKSIDDYAFGGGAGMVLSIEPFAKCINQLKENTNKELHDIANFLDISIEGFKIIDKSLKNKTS